MSTYCKHCHIDQHWLSDWPRHIKLCENLVNSGYNLAVNLPTVRVDEIELRTDLYNLLKIKSHWVKRLNENIYLKMPRAFILVIKMVSGTTQYDSLLQIINKTAYDADSVEEATTLIGSYTAMCQDLIRENRILQFIDNFLPLLGDTSV